MKKKHLSHMRFRIIRKLLKIMLIVGCGIWLSERNKAQTRAIAKREVQSQMNVFLSIASHELKTPLTSIKGNIQLVGRRLKQHNANQSEETRHLLAEVSNLLDHTDQQITRLTRIINNALETTRIGDTTKDWLFELIELNHLLQEIMQDSYNLPRDRNLKFHIPEHKTLVVKANATRIKHVILHLLSNAHKFSPLEKSIEIFLQEDGQVAKITVHDEGPGIDPEEHQHIWERFYRIPTIAVLNGSEVGLGLGLHISRHIIEQHHGKVGLQSQPGQGSEFWFTLPLEDILTSQHSDQAE